MTDKEMQELKELTEESTPGKWRWIYNGSDDSFIEIAGSYDTILGQQFCSDRRRHCVFPSDNDMEFIA